jgi:hypothetical protein
MKRLFVLAPVAALALVAFATPASAAPADDLQSLRVDAIQVARDVSHLRTDVNHCRGADDAEVQQLAGASNDISRRAAGLAPLLGGRQHVIALDLQMNAENDFWYLVSLQAPEICYQPPAE